MSLTGCCGARNSALSAPNICVNSSVKRSSGVLLLALRSGLSAIGVAPHRGCGKYSGRNGPTTSLVCGPGEKSPGRVMPSVSLLRWRNDRMPRLTELDVQAAASLALVPPQPNLVEE